MRKPVALVRPQSVAYIVDLALDDCIGLSWGETTEIYANYALQNYFRFGSAILNNGRQYVI